MIGTDIEAVPRLARLLLNKPRIIRKFFSAYEWDYANAKANTAQTLTGIWCAKEAVVKAFSNHEAVLVTDIAIHHLPNGAPYVCAITGQALLEKYDVQISISHTSDYATAVAMVTLKGGFGYPELSI